MEKRDVILGKCMTRRISESAEKIRNLADSLESISTELENMLENFLSKLSYSQKLTQTVLLSDQEINKLCGLEPKYTTMLSKLTQTLLTDHSKGADVNTSIDDAHFNDTFSPTDLDESRLSDPEEFTTELTRLSKCNLLNHMLETAQGLEHAKQTAQLNYLETSRKYSSIESQVTVLQASTAAKVDPQEFYQLKEECDRMSCELALLDDIDMMRRKTEYRLVKQKQYLDRMDMVVQRVIQKFIWLKFTADLLQLELSCCEEMDSDIQALYDTTKGLIQYTQNLLTRLVSAQPSDADVALNKLSQDIAVEKFARIVTHALLKTSLPEECTNLLANPPSQKDSIPVVLNKLKMKLDKDKQSIYDSSATLSRYIERLQKQFESVESILLRPDDTSTIPGTHLEHLNPARIRYSSGGLCSSTIINLISDTCTDLNKFTDELRVLQHEADILFPTC